LATAWRGVRVADRVAADPQVGQLRGAQCFCERPLLKRSFWYSAADSRHRQLWLLWRPSVLRYPVDGLILLSGQRQLDDARGGPWFKNGDIPSDVNSRATFHGELAVHELCIVWLDTSSGRRSRGKRGLGRHEGRPVRLYQLNPNRLRCRADVVDVTTGVAARKDTRRGCKPSIPLTRRCAQRVQGALKL